MAIKTVQEQLEEVQAAISNVMAGQSYSVGNRNVTRAHLKDLNFREERLLARYLDASCLELFRSDNRTESADGTGVDLLDYHEKLLIVLDVGTVSGTLPTLDVKIQDSADNASFTDLGLAYTQVTASGGLQYVSLDTGSCRRYIRAVATIGGTSPNVNFAVLACGRKQVA